MKNGERGCKYHCKYSFDFKSVVCVSNGAGDEKKDEGKIEIER